MLFRSAVKGIACLGIHQNRFAAGEDRVAQIAYQRHVGDEFRGRDAADGAHDEIQTDEAVGGGDDVVWTRKQTCRCDLHIEKAGVIHQNQARLFFGKTLHADLVDGKFCFEQLGNGQNADQTVHEAARTTGLSVLWRLDCNDLFIRQVAFCDFHDVDGFRLKAFLLL